MLLNSCHNIYVYAIKAFGQNIFYSLFKSEFN